MCYVELIIVNHGVLCCSNGGNRVMLSEWLLIIVCYAEAVVVNHGVICRGSSY